MACAKPLLIWTIYERPRDFPHGYVVRPFTILPGIPVPGAARYAMSLEEARSLVPPGLVRLGRHKSDDPVILESWV